MRFKKTIIIFLISFLSLNFSLIYAINKNQENNKYFRIHVVANSDSIDDQLLKYTLSKYINEYITQLTNNCSTKQESKEVVENNIENILDLCHQTLKDNNSTYDITAYIGKQFYDEKQQNNIRMSSGIYDSLKIVIGNGQGQNWWSLIYPTTFYNINTIDNIDENVHYSFGVIELFKNMFM